MGVFVVVGIVSLFQDETAVRKLTPEPSVCSRPPLRRGASLERKLSRPGSLLVTGPVPDERTGCLGHREPLEKGQGQCGQRPRSNGDAMLMDFSVRAEERGRHIRQALRVGDLRFHYTACSACDLQALPPRIHPKMDVPRRALSWRAGSLNSLTACDSPLGTSWASMQSRT